MTALLERLRARYTEGSREEHLVNPYGPAAADTIEQQAARIESMAREIEGIARDLVNQDGDPWMVEGEAGLSLRLHYWRDKAIKAAAAMRALTPGMEDMNDGRE